MGTSSPSVSDQVADVHRMIETCGLKYVMHSAGTTLGTYGVSRCYNTYYICTLCSSIVLQCYLGHLRNSSSSSSSYVDIVLFHLISTNCGPYLSAAGTEITGEKERRALKAERRELTGLCTLFIYLLTLFCFCRRILGPGSSGYRTGAYHSPSEGSCSYPY